MCSEPHVYDVCIVRVCESDILFQLTSFVCSHEARNIVCAVNHMSMMCVLYVCVSQIYCFS